MKVIYIQNVSGIAKRGDIRHVADGYALNYLLPQGLAVRSTAAKEQALEEQQASVRRSQSKALELVRELASKLKGTTIVISQPTSPTGTLYAAVTPEVVVQALSKQADVTLQPVQVRIPHNLKSLGEHQIEISLHPEVTINVILNISA